VREYEGRILPLFFEHYAPRVDRSVVFDDQSDDGTAQVLARHPKVDLRAFPPTGSSFMLAALGLWQHAWKESRGRADWVVLTNVDAFFRHPAGMRAYLQRCTDEGTTIILPRGYEMVCVRPVDAGCARARGARSRRGRRARRRRRARRLRRHDVAAAAGGSRSRTGGRAAATRGDRWIRRRVRRPAGSHG